MATVLRLDVQLLVAIWSSNIYFYSALSRDAKFWFYIQLNGLVDNCHWVAGCNMFLCAKAATAFSAS